MNASASKPTSVTHPRFNAVTNDGTSDRPGDLRSPAASLCCPSVRPQRLQSNQITNVTQKEASKRAASALWFHGPSPINNLSAWCHLHSERGRGAVTIPARWIWEKMAHTNESLAPGNFRRHARARGRPTAAIPSNV